MIYSLLVLSSPANGHCSGTAAAFASEVLARGHTIHRVFFLDEGVAVGNAGAVFPQDEQDRIQPWLSLARENEVELVLCVSSALRRGLLDEGEARRYEKNAATIDPAFTISGLGQLVDASIAADRLVTFGG